jgi:hypothetical protein
MLLWGVVEGQASSPVLGTRTAEEATASVDHQIGRLFRPGPVRPTVC